MKKDSVQKLFCLKKLTVARIKELAEENDTSETEIVEQAINYYYNMDAAPEHIILGRIGQVQSQLTTMDRKIETLAGIFYYSMPYIFGVIPPLPKNEVDKNGRKYNPAFDKGNDILMKIILNYRNEVKTHKISFMQNVWADMQEHLNMTEINNSNEGMYERATGN